MLSALDLTALVSFPVFKSGVLFNGDLRALVSLPACAPGGLFYGVLPVAVVLSLLLPLVAFLLNDGMIDSFETGRSFGFQIKPFSILSSSVNLSGGPYLCSGLDKNTRLVSLLSLKFIFIRLLSDRCMPLIFPLSREK